MEKPNGNMDRQKITQIIDALKSSRHDKRLVLSYFATSCNYDEMQAVYDKAPQIYKGLLSFSFLKRAKLENVFQGSPMYYGTPAEYVEKAAFIVGKHAAIINKYVDTSLDVDKAMLWGNYEEARSKLKEIEKFAGASFWSAMYDIKIERLFKGLNASIKLHNEYYSKSQQMVKWMMNAAFRSSSLDYSDPTTDLLVNPEDSDGAKSFNGVMRVFCFPWTGIYEGDWMCYGLVTSLIDLYNGLMLYLPNLKEESRNDERVRKSIGHLASVLSDPYLQKLALLWGLDNNYRKDSQRDAIIYSYTSRKYEKAIELATPYLDEHPEDFELLRLYLQAMALAGRPMPDYNREGYVLERIKYYLSSIVYHKGTLPNHVRMLRGICRSQHQIRGMMLLEVMVDSLNLRFLYGQFGENWKYNKFQDATDSLFYKGEDTRLEYLSTLPMATSYTKNVFSHRSHPLTPDYLEVSIGYQNGGYIYSYIEESIKAGSVPPFLLDAAHTYIFDELINKELFRQAVEFYVSARINDISIDFIITSDQKKQILTKKEQLFQEIPLEMAIYMQMTNEDEHAMYFAYKKYLKSKKVQKASDIKTIDNSLLRYFLGNVATMRVLTYHVLQFKTEEEVMDERIRILSNLNETFGDKVYTEEISSISRDKKIRELNAHVDESKIYVDIQSIKDNELADVQTLFENYEAADNQTKLLKKSGEAELVEYFRDIESNVDIIYVGVSAKQREVTDYKLDVLTKIFKIVRDQFLFNPKSGLDNYLSTRIRHGTLVNKLRNCFEISNLVTNTIHGEYSSNDFWINKKFGLRDVKVLECMSLFSQFSTQIDGIISRIKNDFIQVQTEETKDKQDGCFDYQISFFYNEINDLLFRTDIVSSEDCVNAILDILWKHTEICLESVKIRLAQAQNEMLEALKQLEKNIADVVGLENLSWGQFNDAVIQCQSALQTDVQAVIAWFKLSGFVDFTFTIDQVISSSIAFVKENNRNPINIIVRQDTDKDELKGEYFGALYDMFHDLLNNAQDNENVTKVGGNCIINVSQELGFLNIEVSNPISNSIENGLIDKVKKTNESLSALLTRGRSRADNNSGCTKIFNAVHNHLGSRNNKYTNQVEDHRFVASISIELEKIMARKHENIAC